MTRDNSDGEATRREDESRRRKQMHRRNGRGRILPRDAQNRRRTVPLCRTRTNLSNGSVCEEPPTSGSPSASFNRVGIVRNPYAEFRRHPDSEERFGKSRGSPREREDRRHDFVRKESRSRLQRRADVGRELPFKRPVLRVSSSRNLRRETCNPRPVLIPGEIRFSRYLFLSPVDLRRDGSPAQASETARRQARRRRNESAVYGSHGRGEP